jgi:outer membrane protein OmpA-like peptidoglycan-associated protein
MDSVVNTDALLYVVVAKTLMAIVFLIIAAVAIKFGAQLFRRGLDVSSTEKNVSDQEVNVKRLPRDTWLPKGTLIKTKEKSDDDRFVKLEKDSWMPTGTLVRTPARDLETQLKLQIAGVVLMLSSLFWGWMSYLTSPLDVQSLNTQLAGTHEHKIRNLLGNLQGEIGTLLTNIRDLKQASDSNVKTDTLQTGLNQIGNVLTNQLSALQQEMGVIKSEMATVKTQPQQLQQSINNLSTQVQQLATEQVAVTQQNLSTVKSGVENNQVIALQQTQQSIATLANQVQTALGQLQHNLHPQAVIEKLHIVDNELAQIKQAINQPPIDNNLQATLQAIQQELTSLKTAQSAPVNLDMQVWVDHFNTLKGDVGKLQQDLGSLKTTATDSSGNNQEVKASLGKAQEELARLQPLIQEMQALKTMLTELSKKFITDPTEQFKQPFSEIKTEVINLRKDLESKLQSAPILTQPQSVQTPAPVTPFVEEVSNTILKTLTASETPKLKDWGAYIDISLPYGTGKTKPNDLSSLVKLGEALQSPQLSGKEILLQGYTDDKGEYWANREVSQKRADYTKSYLVKHYGLEAAKIQTEGKGWDNPIASNKTNEGRTQNRRIRVSVR